ncbi:MAG: hypothetical protein JWR13_5574 [Mycobacterium sp.]|jgi:hypothetical protein|nr:hypothetical protein [Mycobacterium sp.]MCW2734758.1 hypothetical protein [Mycobacterium sp.]MDT5311376.1 hypothetical protein [Mycobacterium sp.]
MSDWWRNGSGRARLRRRLLVLSTPVAIVLFVVLVKLWSVVIAGSSAATDFAERDTDALRGDVATLGVLNVTEPANAYFAAGDLAVLDDRLDEAERQFGQALAHTEPASSCRVLVNLELVRETLGDRAAATFDGRVAVNWYRSALAAVDDAPDGCFKGSTDADEERRAVLDGAAARLADKIDKASVAPAAPPPPPVALPPAPQSSAAGSAPTEPDRQLRLNPGVGDPLERLQQILRDAATAQNGG